MPTSGVPRVAAPIAPSLPLRKMDDVTIHTVPFAVQVERRAADHRHRRPAGETPRKRQRSRPRPCPWAPTTSVSARTASPRSAYRTPAISAQLQVAPTRDGGARRQRLLELVDDLKLHGNGCRRLVLEILTARHHRQLGADLRGPVAERIDHRIARTLRKVIEDDRTRDRRCTRHRSGTLAVTPPPRHRTLSLLFEFRSVFNPRIPTALYLLASPTAGGQVHDRGFTLQMIAVDRRAGGIHLDALELADERIVRRPAARSSSTRVETGIEAIVEGLTARLVARNPRDAPHSTANASAAAW